MIGMAMKKENSAARVLVVPTIMPPRMDEPDRDVPGISDSI